MLAPPIRNVGLRSCSTFAAVCLWHNFREAEANKTSFGNYNRCPQRHEFRKCVGSHHKTSCLLAYFERADKMSKMLVDSGPIGTSQDSPSLLRRESRTLSPFTPGQTQDPFLCFMELPCVQSTLCEIQLPNEPTLLVAAKHAEDATFDVMNQYRRVIDAISLGFHATSRRHSAG